MVGGCYDDPGFLGLGHFCFVRGVGVGGGIGFSCSCGFFCSFFAPACHPPSEGAANDYPYGHNGDNNPYNPLWMKRIRTRARGTGVGTRTGMGTRARFGGVSAFMFPTAIVAAVRVIRFTVILSGSNRVGNPNAQHAKGHIRAQREEEGPEEERSKMGIWAEMRGHGIISQNKNEESK